MKTLSLTTLLIAAALMGGCATAGKSVAEQTPGKFVTYVCEGNKSFQVRYDAELGTARIRTHDGSAELTRGDRGLFRDDEGHWVLTLVDGNSTELMYMGKATYTKCSAK